MTFSERRSQACSLRTIPLESILRLLGAQPDKQDKHKWHVADEVLSVNEPKFMNWSRGVGGGGAIDLIIHLKKLSFTEAVEWLGQNYLSVTTPEPLPTRPRSSLSLPPPDPGKLGDIKRYLISQRGISPHLIDNLIQTRVLYADCRANAVFLLLGSENTPVGAELRGTTGYSWRGMAPGSRKDLGFFAIPASRNIQQTILRQALILCESAIDAMSCFELHPGATCVSTAGARPNPPWLKVLLEQYSQVYCGFDADTTGEEMARCMALLHPTIKRLRPAHHDWNDVLKMHAIPHQSGSMTRSTPCPIRISSGSESAGPQ